MKKCEFEECGYHADKYDNNCAMLRDLSYSGCTCDIHCETFRTTEEIELLEKVLLYEKTGFCKNVVRESKKRIKEIREETNRRINEKTDTM